MNQECWGRNTCSLYRDKLCNAIDQEKLSECQRYFRLNALADNANLTALQRQWTNIILLPEEKQTDGKYYCKLQEIENNIEKFVQNGGNIYIHSFNCGNGKTMWALRLLQDYFLSIWYKAPVDSCKGLFINVPRFLQGLKDNISYHDPAIEHIKNNILTADLIVWDEIATKALTTYEHEQLFGYINARLDAGKSNIYTSNMPPEELRNLLGDRLYSRIVNLSEDIPFTGCDKRVLKKGSI